MLNLYRSLHNLSDIISILYPWKRIFKKIKSTITQLLNYLAGKKGNRDSNSKTEVFLTAPQAGWKTG